MRRLLALAASVLLVLVGSISVAAQPASPTPTGDPSITAFALGELPELPAGAAYLRLLRITLEPGGALPWNVGRQQATTGVVQEGEVAIHFEGDALREPFDSSAPIPVPPGSVVTAATTDGFFAGKDTTFTVLNVSDAPAVVLIGSLEPDAWAPGQSISRFINFELVRSELLGVGIAQQLPAAPAAMVLVRAVYEPGQGDAESSPVGGPTIAYVDSGEFSYTLTSGSAELTSSSGQATPTTDTLTAGDAAITLRQGDAVFAEDASTLVRNGGTEPATAIIVFVRPTAE